ncbi:hypothetical protein [Sphingobacterium sp. LRF_L2]|uniref:hypothetical protein n=1 Tax=Sphingobacterium sp. LRF_L2 TaxID=3369421 RepID=UPI003F617B0A
MNRLVGRLAGDGLHLVGDCRMDNLSSGLLITNTLSSSLIVRSLKYIYDTPVILFGYFSKENV